MKIDAVLLRGAPLISPDHPDTAINFQKLRVVKMLDLNTGDSIGAWFRHSSGLAVCMLEIGTATLSRFQYCEGINLLPV